MLYATSIDFTGLNMSDRHRLWMLGILSVGLLLLAALFPPIPQPVEYHQFADQRSYFGVPNFFNVVSNGAFLLVGMAGLGFLLRSRGAHAANAFVTSPERWPYL